MSGSCRELPTGQSGGMAGYHLLSHPGEAAAASNPAYPGAVAARDGRRRTHEGLRLVVGSAAAIALLIACAYTTLRGQMHAGSHAGARLEGDTELVRELARGGLASYEDSDGFGELTMPPSVMLRTGPAPWVSDRQHSAGFEMMPLGQNKKKVKNEKEGGGCDGEYCASGRLQIEDIKPAVCDTQGGCVITFRGSNIVAGPDLEGLKADKEMQVFLIDQKDHDKVVSKCSPIHWVDFLLFECTLQSGTGKDLTWNVSIPNHDHKDKAHGTGWTWQGDQGYRQQGQPCSLNSCGYYFSFRGPQINLIEPNVLDVNEENILLIHGNNFGEDPFKVQISVNGVPCKETELVNDNRVRCLMAPVAEPGILNLDVNISGQVTEAKIPVKDIPESTSFPFTVADTLGTEQWNITMAAIMVQTGLSQAWFESHTKLLLAPTVPQSASELRASFHLEDWEAVSVMIFREYLENHFAADAGHAMEDEDGVYISALGNKLNGDKEHDEQVLLKQLQVMEAATGESRQQLSRVVGDEIKTEPPCAGYPNCLPADAVGHRGWTWHWIYDAHRDSWAWEYAAISDGKEPPVSCGYCDPVKLHASHTEDFMKLREEKCMHCVHDHFKNMDSCECADFKNMCLQATKSVDGVMLSGDGLAKHPTQQLRGRLAHAVSEESAAESALANEPVAASSPLVDPPYSATQCAVEDGVKKCAEIGGVPSADGLTCCASGCSECGANVFAGADCSIGTVQDSGVRCGTPPCVFDSAPKEIKDRQDVCASFMGVSDGLTAQCCAASCVVCGGEACANAPGGADSCCINNIVALDKMCTDSTHAPCTLKAGGGPGTEPSGAASGAPTSSGPLSVAEQCLAIGGLPDPYGQFCCSASCGKCGGQECERLPGGGDACCGDYIGEAQVVLSGSNDF